MFKTKRRWLWASVALPVFATAWIVGHVPAVRQGGWWAAAPRPVLIVMIPYIEHAGALNWTSKPPPLLQHIEQQVFRGEWELAPLWWPERVLLWRSSRAALRQSGDITRAFGARGLVLLDPDAVEAVRESERAPVILARAALTYARATTYIDRGVVKGSIGVRDETHFGTAFARPDCFRFEFISGHPHEYDLSNRYAIWCDGGPVRRWWTVQQSAGIQTERSLAFAIAGATGVSKASAHRVPRLLLPDEIGGFTLTDLTNPQFNGFSELGGRACVRVSAGSLLESRELWIDAERYLLLKIEEGGRFPRVTTYQPQINIPIPKDWFDFDQDRPELSPVQDPNPPRPGAEGSWSNG